MKDVSQYIINKNASIKEALVQLDKLSGDVLTLIVINEDEIIVGTLTDGDIRRKLISDCSLDDPIHNVMKTNFYYLWDWDLDVNQIREIKNKGIVLIPLLNKEKKIVNILNLKHLKSILPIDAVLMAGGKGERLRPLTENTPKPLLPVGNKPIIDYNIENLISYGISHINVTVNYLKEQLEDHFCNPINGVQINCVKEPRYLGTIGSIKYIDSFYNDTILVMNSDLFTNINYEDFFLHFQTNEADMSVAAVPYSVSIPYGIFDLTGRDINGIKEKPSFNYYINAGIYLIKKRLLNLIPNDTFFNATDLIELLINNNYKIIRFPITGYWIDIGKHEEYMKAQELVKHL